MSTISHCLCCLCHRRGNQRNPRRNREDERLTVSEVIWTLDVLPFFPHCSSAYVVILLQWNPQRPAPLMKTTEPESPKFDLAASNFPPLPGSVVSVPGETTTEMRLSDVVRGIKVTNIVEIPPTLVVGASTHSKMEICNYCSLPAKRRTRPNTWIPATPLLRNLIQWLRLHVLLRLRLRRQGALYIKQIQNLPQS